MLVALGAFNRGCACRTAGFGDHQGLIVTESRVLGDMDVGLRL
jgi:hypothetical protein